MTNRTNPSYPLGAAYGLAAIAIWSGWMTITRLGVTTTLNTWDLTALRFGVGGILLLPVVWRHGWALDRLGWPRLLLLIAGAGAPYALIAAEGLRFAPAADAGALIPGVMPLFVALLATVFLPESFSNSRKTGFALILTGILAIAGSSLLSGDWTRTAGHALFLTASLMWATFTLIMRWANLAPLHAAALVSTGSMIGFFPVYFAVAGFRILDAPLTDLATQGIYQGLLTTVVSLTLFGRAVAILGASSGAAFGALVPALAALLAIPFLGEIPGTPDIIGILTISLGVYLASGGPLARRRRTATS